MHKGGFTLAAALIAAALTTPPIANADNPTPPSLPEFAPHESDWQPNTVVYPYNLWQNRVTPPSRSPPCATPVNGSTPSTNR